MTHPLQKIFNDLMEHDTRPQFMKGVGRKPGKPKRVQITGATVLDVTQTNPTDGGVLVNTGFPLFANLSIEDINQGWAADCYFLATLAALAATQKGRDYIKSILFIDQATGKAIAVYTRAGTVTRIHCDLLVSTSFNQFDPLNQDIWVEIMEKTYAFFRTGADTYKSLDYGFCSAVCQDIGCSPASYQGGLQNAAFSLPAANGLLAGNIAMCLTPSSPPIGLVGGHAYTIMSVGSDGSAILRNPWGKTAGAEYTTIQNKDLLSVNMYALESGTVPNVAPVNAPVFTQADIDASYRKGMADKALKVKQLLVAVNEETKK